jgi:hypothetical protein
MHAMVEECDGAYAAPKQTKVGAIMVGWEVDTPAHQKSEADLWRLAFQDVPVLWEVPNVLGLSRCAALRRTCKPWAASTRSPFKPVHLGHELAQDCCPAPAALLNVLDTPSLSCDSLMDMEDTVYSILSDRRLRDWIPEMLLSCANKNEYLVVQDFIADLRPKCKLAPKAVDAILQPCIEREQNVVLQPQSIHLAVVHNAARLVRMLLAKASQTGVMSQMLSNGLHSSSPSLMFLAVLFADMEVIEALKAAGAQFNSCDQAAASRLDQAGLWTELQTRMANLGLAAVAQEWSAKLDDQKVKAQKIREAAREKAAAALARAAATRAIAQQAN